MGAFLEFLPSVFQFTNFWSSNIVLIIPSLAMMGDWLFLFFVVAVVAVGLPPRLFCFCLCRCVLLRLFSVPVLLVCSFCFVSWRWSFLGRSWRRGSFFWWSIVRFSDLKSAFCFGSLILVVVH